eukprot:3161126-Amphidinium_carterae.1
MQLEALDLSMNKFGGPWPKEGLTLLTCMEKLVFTRNKLSGSFPADGMQGMAALIKEFTISANAFSGTWPERGLRGTTNLKILGLGANRFTSTLPDIRFGALSDLQFEMNKFTGNLSA